LAARPRLTSLLAAVASTSPGIRFSSSRGPFGLPQLPLCPACLARLSNRSGHSGS
jgi:hypothetical protein